MSLSTGSSLENKTAGFVDTDLDGIHARLENLSIETSSAHKDSPENGTAGHDLPQTQSIQSVPMLQVPGMVGRALLAKKKLLVFDLNGFFVHRVQGPVPESIGRQPDFRLNKFKVYKRPHVDSFIEMCKDKFHLAVWSSAMRHNVEGMAKNLFGEDFNTQLEAVMDRNDCTMTNLRHPLEYNKFIAIKELRRLWVHPALKGRFDESNTLLIDDSPHKAALNPPYTTLSPPSWTADQPEDAALGHDGAIATFLSALADAPDVPSFIESHDPFPAAAKEPMEVDLTKRVRHHLRSQQEQSCLRQLEKMQISAKDGKSSTAAAEGQEHQTHSGTAHARHNPDRKQTRTQGKNLATGEKVRNKRNGQTRTEGRPKQDQRTVVCRHWQNYGSCAYGDKCRFLHNGAAGKASNQPADGGEPENDRQ